MHPSMSSFTYLSKAVVTSVATTTAEEAVRHIRRLSSSSEEQAKQWYPFKNELNFRLAGFGAAMVTILFGLCLVQVLVRCCNCRPIQPDAQHASCQPVPRRIIPTTLMSIEPALNFTHGLKLAGTGTDHPECSICLTEFVEGEDIRILSNCRHGYHLKCIEPWLLRQSSSCPICRTSVNQSLPKNQQLQNDVDLEAAVNPPETEMSILQQQQRNGVHVEAANVPESEIYSMWYYNNNSSRPQNLKITPDRATLGGY